MNNELISLYTIYKTLKNIYEKQLELRNKYVEKMNLKLNQYYNKECFIDKKIYIFMCGYDYEKDEIYIGLMNKQKKIEKYYFKKKQGILIKEYKDELNHTKLNIIMDDLCELYDFYQKIKPLYKSYTEIKINNSQLYIDFNINIMDLYSKKNTKEKKSYIKIFTYTDECDIGETFNNSSDNYIEELKKTYIKKDNYSKFLLNSYENIKKL